MKKIKLILCLIIVAYCGLSELVIAQPLTFPPADSMPASLKSNAEQVQQLTNIIGWYQTALQKPWPVITFNKILKLGMYNSNIPLIRDRLIILQHTSAYFSVDSPEKTKFDAGLMQAVKNFQAANGLVVDGIIGPNTIRMLNVTPAQLIAQLRVNIARWQKIPANQGAEYLWINIPSYQLELIKNGQVIFTMPIIVGKIDRPTPELFSKVTTIILNPTWNVPDSILKKDIIPKVMANPNYLKEKHIRVYASWDDNSAVINPANINWEKIKKMDKVPYRFTQVSGKDNALGRVKFSFLNNDDIYLHDTPEKSLFDTTDRVYSSGCIRLAEPLKLLDYLINNNMASISGAQVQQRLDQGDIKYVRLGKPIPIYITYITAWIDTSGHLQLRKDVYQKDNMSAIPASRR